MHLRRLTIMRSCRPEHQKYPQVAKPRPDQRDVQDALARRTLIACLAVGVIRDLLFAESRFLHCFSLALWGPLEATVPLDLTCHSLPGQRPSF